MVIKSIDSRRSPFYPFTLPNQVEPEEAEAIFENGVLTLTVPKAAAAKPKTVKVEARGMMEGKK